MKFLTTTNSRDHSLSGVLLSKYIIKIMLSSVPGSSLRRNSRYFTIAPSLTQSLFILLSFEVCSLLQLSSRAFSSFATSWCVVFGWHLSVYKNIRVFYHFGENARLDQSFEAISQNFFAQLRTFGNEFVNG